MTVASAMARVSDHAGIRVAADVRKDVAQWAAGGFAERGVADDDQSVPGAGQGDVDAAPMQWPEEAEVTAGVAADHGIEGDIGFAALDGVDGVDLDVEA